MKIHNEGIPEIALVGGTAGGLALYTATLGTSHILWALLLLIIAFIAMYTAGKRFSEKQLASHLEKHLPAAHTIPNELENQITLELPVILHNAKVIGLK